MISGLFLMFVRALCLLLLFYCPFFLLLPNTKYPSLRPSGQNVILLPCDNSYHETKTSQCFDYTDSKFSS